MFNTLDEIKASRPELHLGNLAGPEGNAHWVLARAATCLSDLCTPDYVIKSLVAEAKSGNYIGLLMTMDKYFETIIDTEDGPLIFSAAEAGRLVYERVLRDNERLTYG
jgi:hypothetical protein